MRRLVITVLLGLGALLSVANQARAWPTQPPNRVTISGPGLKGEIEITDAETLTALRLGSLEDFDHPTGPEDREGAYIISRWFQELDGQQFGILHYYPPMAGYPGKVFFQDGPAISTHTPYHNHWYETRPLGDAAIQNLLVRLAQARPGPVSSVGAAPITLPVAGAPIPSLTASLVIIGLGIGAVGAWLGRRRQYKLFSILLLALLLIAAANHAEAKGPPSCATVAGPGINGTVNVKDPEILKAFALTEFQDFSSRLAEPPAVRDREGYLVTNYFAPDCKAQPFDHWTYYRNPAGGLGFVYYDGIVNGYSQYDRKWYRVTGLGDLIMGQLLARLAPNTPKTLLPVTGANWDSSRQLAASGLGLIFAAGLVLFATRNKWRGT